MIMSFKVYSNFNPTKDQKRVTSELSKKGNFVLLGVTGSGKTFVLSKLIEKEKKPALVISANKTLAAQLYQEFKSFFPKAYSHYFVSYYDYYQPEAYIPQLNKYIEKDAKINKLIDKLRHAAVQDIIQKRHVIVSASVSCIYNLGSPENYQKVSLFLQKGQTISQREIIKSLISLQYQRTETEEPGTFKIRGDKIIIFPVSSDKKIEIELKNNKLTNSFEIFPANFWIPEKNKLDLSLQNIESELQQRIKELKKHPLKAQRIEQRTKYDLEMIKELGYCSGIENYSSHLEFRKPGKPPFCLLDYFKKAYKDFLIIIDESHITIPQLKAMAVQDRIRKQTLIDHGFRLKSAIDNRPLTLNEFENKQTKTIYVSATPAEYEKKRAKIIELLTRPTGLLEPEIQIKPCKNQIQETIKEIKGQKEKTLVITISKKLAELISERFIQEGIKSQWIHSETKTLERPEILKNLRQGKYDVLVGVNLLREGLDLPEVGLIIILDADKEGFLRSTTTLIQTMGRAARNEKAKVILFADKITRSMQAAIEETDRRRKIQKEFNRKNKIIPKKIVSNIKEWSFFKKEIKTEFFVKDKKILEKEMKKAAQGLNFERAAELRDLIKKLC
ncbi:MAG: excinuclease ABC subunit UvrB [Candidatus Pacebacteria bacterium]|nr:excinuclease ABC subunit UvrB [Candidatus Paceibacterota bacterium]